MVRIGMEKTEHGVGYFAINQAGYRTTVRMGWEGLLKVIGEACAQERRRVATRAWRKERKQSVVNLFVRLLVEESLQLRADAMPEGRGLAILIARCGGHRFAFTDRDGLQSKTTVRHSRDAVVLAEAQALGPKR